MVREIDSRTALNIISSDMYRIPIIDSGIKRLGITF